MDSALVTVVETRSYLADAAKILTEVERMALIDRLAADPECGDLIPEGGGIRKLRIGVGGRGKRGGARVIYYYHSRRVPVFLLALFAKNEQADMTRKQLHDYARVAKAIAKEYGRR
jgi:hypothetical protein